MTKKIVMGVVALSLLVLPLAGACAKPAPEGPAPTLEEEGIVTAPEKLDVGIFFLTTGLWANQTGPESYGARDACLWQNEQGGIIFKDPETGKDTRILINVVHEETGGDIPTSISAYKKFREQGCDLMVSMVSHEAEALASMAVKDKQPFHESCSTPLLNTILPRYVVTYFPRYEDAAGTALDFIAKEDPGCKVGFLALDITCGRSSIEPVVMEYAESLGLDPLPPEVVPFTVTDFSVELNRLKSQGAKWVFAILTSGHAAVMLGDMKRIGWEPDVDCKVFMAQCTQGDVIGAVAGFGGFYYATMLHMEFAEGRPAETDEAYKIIRAMWEKQGGEDLCKFYATYPLMFGELMPWFEGVKLAAEEYGWPLSPEQIMHGLYMLRDYNWYDIAPAAQSMYWDQDATMCKGMTLYYFPKDFAGEETYGAYKLLGTPGCPHLGEVAIPEKPVWE